MFLLINSFQFIKLDISDHWMVIHYYPLSYLIMSRSQQYFTSNASIIKMNKCIDSMSFLMCNLFEGLLGESISWNFNNPVMKDPRLGSFLTCRFRQIFRFYYAR